MANLEEFLNFQKFKNSSRTIMQEILQGLLCRKFFKDYYAGCFLNIVFKRVVIFLNSASSVGGRPAN